MQFGRAELTASGVVTTGDGIEFCINARLLQSCVQKFTLMERDYGILIAMNNQKRWGIGTDVGDGIGCDHLVGVINNGTTYIT